MKDFAARFSGGKIFFKKFFGFKVRLSLVGYHIGSSREKRSKNKPVSKEKTP